MDEPSSGPELALEDLRWLRALAARLVRDPHLADDAVQETLVAALERRPRAAGSLRAWLGTILRNALRQEWRGRARRARRERETRPTDSARSTLEVVEELALHRRLVERVQSLDEPYRTAVVLRYLRGREVAEIACELGVPEKTVRTRLERALAQLREHCRSERDAWLVLLFPAAPPPFAPVLPALLVPMNLKLVAALLGLCLVGALVYLRTASASDARVAQPAEHELPAEVEPIRATLDAPQTAGQREELASTRSPTPFAATGAPGPGELHGFVRTLDGGGLAGLEVLFEAGGQGTFAAAADAPRARSGAAGEFALPRPEGRGRLDVRSAEYVGLVRPQLDGALPLSTPIVVAAPLRSYSGTVVDEDGAPLAGARVELTLDGSFVQSRDVGGEAVHLLLPFAETTCDEAGAFRFERAGFVAEAFLEAKADGHVAGRLALPPASSAGLELVLAGAPDGPRTIHGLVLDALEAPVAGAQVSLGGPTVESDADGRFRIDSEAWRKGGWIRAFRPGSLPGELELETALDGSSAEDPIVLHLGAEPRSIRGRVLDAEGEPVAGARVWTPDTTPFGEVVLREGENSFQSGTTVEALLSGSTQPWATQIGVETDQQGNFTLNGLLERSYVLFALDARSLEGAGPLEVFAGARDAVLRLARAPRARVAGRVVSRAGVPLAGVSVSPGRRFAWRADASAGAGRWIGFAIATPFAAQMFPAAAVTDAEGRFELGPLVPQGSFLALRGKALVLGASFELAGAPDLAALEIAVDASSRFRVSLARAAEATAFRLVDADGAHLPMFLEVEGVTISSPNASIDHGQSGVVLAAEGEHLLVLLDGEDEVRRVPVHLQAGGLHELRL